MGEVRKSAAQTSDTACTLANESVRCLVFAHVPPPHHGQSQMVLSLVEGLRARPELGVELIHVDARLSEDLVDVGSARKGKLGRLILHCLQAIQARIRFGVRLLYYIPSPPKRNSLYRDWIAMLLLRPFFPKRIYHWEAVGLGRWTQENARPWERWISRKLLGRARLSVVLTPANEADARVFAPMEVVSISNAVADPFASDWNTLAEERRRRWEARRSGSATVEVLFLALCSEDKGVLDAVRMVLRANALEGGNTENRLTFRLTVAGAFPSPEQETRFHALVQELGAGDLVRYLGFVRGAQKQEAIRSADVFLFPTYYSAEGQPLNLMEACAAGLPVVATRWRGIPEMFWDGYRGLIDPQDILGGATALMEQARQGDPDAFRALYETRFSLTPYCQAMACAMRRVGRE